MSKKEIIQSLILLVVVIVMVYAILWAGSITSHASEQLAENEKQKGIEKLEYEEELYLLSHLINAEAGSDWCSDDLMRYVAVWHLTG